MASTDNDQVLVLAESEIVKESLVEYASQCSDCNCPDGDCCTDY